MNQISEITKVFSVRLNVTKEQIQKKLALAPVYTFLLFWIFYFFAFLINGELSSSLSFELFGIFLAYTIVILLIYFIITYIFIYVSQLLLIKCNRLNLWFILGSAIALTFFFTFVIFIITSLDIGLRGFNLGVLAFIGFFAISFALMYWFLLFRQHRKNESANLQGF